MDDYGVIETSWGPRIDGSRMMVYDVMIYYDKGSSASYIAENYNLPLEKVKGALGYIEANREKLQADLRDILPKKAARERETRAFQAELRRKNAQKPKTPEQKAFYALLEERGITLTDEESEDYYADKYGGLDYMPEGCWKE